MKTEIACSMVVHDWCDRPAHGGAGPCRRCARDDLGRLLWGLFRAYTDSGSGTYLSTTLFPKLGHRGADIAGKSRKVRGPPSGEPVAQVEAEIGFQQVAELIHVPGITFVGALPAEVQPTIFFAGALTRTVQQPEAASAPIRFLASSDAAPVILEAGLMPLPER